MNKRERERIAREAALAWLDEHVRTLDARSLGRGLFLANETERKNVAITGQQTLRDNLQETVEAGSVEKDAVTDGVFLGMHLFAAQADAWLGPDAWPASIMLRASVPGASKDELERVLRRDLAPEAVSAEELREVVDAFVASTWGEGARTVPPAAARNLPGPLGVLISAPPHYAMMQYTIGFLWGFALRGLVLRLAFDRSLGTVPETAAAARARLERLLSESSEPLAEEPKAKPTLLQYATEFYGHRDWAALCRPSDGAVAVLEAELEETLPGLAMLAGAEDDDLPMDSQVIGHMPGDWEAVLGFEGMDDDADADEVGMIPLSETVTLDQGDWEAFQRRAVVMGALTADAEALVEAELGPLERNQQPISRWARSLVASGAISGVQAEQGGMLADRLSSPLRRLTTVLRRDFLPYKLRAARDTLQRMYANPAEEPPKQQDPEEDAEAPGGGIDD